MKYQDMPYERVDFDRVEAEFETLKKDFAAAGSGEEQFAVHERLLCAAGPGGYHDDAGADQARREHRG